MKTVPHFKVSEVFLSFFAPTSVATRCASLQISGLLCVALIFVDLFSPARGLAQSYWDGGAAGTGSSWATSANWVNDTIPLSSPTTNVVVDNRNGTGTISTISISGDRTVGLLTLDNINSRLADTLNIDTNGTGSTTARTLTLHTGVTLQNSTTTVAFRGSNGTLSVVLGAANTFSTSAGSYLQFNSTVLISGGFGIQTVGGGTVGLNGQNTFSGGVVVGGGSTLRIGAPTQGNSATSTVAGGELVSGQIGLGTLELQSDSTLLSGGSGQRSLQNNLRMSGNVTFGATSNYTGALVFNSSIGTGTGETLTTPATITLLGNTQVTANVTTSLFNAMSGNFELTKQGLGILRISATNTYSGGTTVASGTLEFGRTGSLGTGDVKLGRVGGGDASLLNYLGGWTFSNDLEVVAGSGGTLTLGYTSLAAFSGIFSGDITLNDGLTLQSTAIDGVAMRISGAISGAHPLTKTGPGAVRLENNNVGYSGVTTISNGTLQIGNGGTTGGVGNNGIINNAALRVNRSNAYTLANVITGTGTVTQAGSGTTTMTQANTYSGLTTVSVGTLLVSNSTGSATGSGPVNVVLGATLGGTGTIAPTGAQGVSIAGTVAPGLPTANDGIGTLTFSPADGNVTFASGSSAIFQLRADGLNDRLVFNGLGSGLLDLSSLSPGSLSVVFAAGYAPAVNDTFDLLDWTALTGSGVSGLSSGLLSLSTTGFDPSWSWDLSQFTTAGIISITVVPEPSRVLLIAAALVSPGLRRRRSCLA